MKVNLTKKKLSTNQNYTKKNCQNLTKLDKIKTNSKLWTMLSKIEISNFKAIGETPLILNELSSVNYLVGANESGKSSVLEVLHLLWTIRSAKLEKHPNNFVIIEDLRKQYPLYGYFDNKTKNTGNIYKNTNLKIETKQKLNEEIEFNVFWKEKSDISPFGFSEKRKDNWYYKNLDKLKKLDKILGETSYICSDTKWLIPENFNNLTRDSFWNTKTEIRQLEKPIVSKTENVEGDFFERYVAILINRYRVFLRNLSINCGGSIIRNYNGNIVNEICEEFNIKKFDRIQNDDLCYVSKNSSGSSGEIAIYELLEFSTITMLNPEEKKFKLIFIDEIEQRLHPNWQKKLPKILNRLTEKLNIQFLISTHSPFIISAAAEFGETQKVYLIEKGQCLNPQGSKKGGAKKLAMEMLGAGVEDILPKKIVICESEVSQYAQDKPNYQKDAFIYQKLYGNLHDVGFYSAGSNEAVFQNNQNINDLIQLIFNGQKSKTEVIGFVDSDYLVKVKKSKYKELRNTGSFNNRPLALIKKIV